MQLTLAISISGIVLVIAYFGVKNVYFKKNENLVIQKAKITKISLQQIGQIWSPELLVSYNFYFHKHVYYGQDYIRIDRILPDIHLYLFDRNSFPVLRTEYGEFAGEEHIETFILQQNQEIQVVFCTHTLPDSKIYKFVPGSKSLFQNTDIKFPWV
ncbi:MAG: hypothetical protein OEV66_09405 [Spirochaetia bacterium]|nr:hypothetical protein [Spirochaetia bacterium]